MPVWHLGGGTPEFESIRRYDKLGMAFHQDQHVEHLPPFRVEGFTHPGGNIIRSARPGYIVHYKHAYAQLIWGNVFLSRTMSLEFIASTIDDGHQRKNDETSGAKLHFQLLQHPLCQAGAIQWRRVDRVKQYSSASDSARARSFQQVFFLSKHFHEVLPWVLLGNTNGLF